jgi:hypothetical protein
MPATLLSPTQAVSAHAFVQSIGVNTHVGYERAWGYGNNAYDNMNMVKSALNWVNIDHVRDRFDYDHVMPRIDELASMGIRFCVNMGTGPGVSYSAEIARIAARANVVEYVEGPNEVDRYPATFNGQTGYAAAVAEMKKLYADIHASLALNGNGNSTPVLNLTFADWRNWTNVGDLSAYVDFGSAHIYPASGEPPLRWLQQGLDQQNLSTPGERMIITEGGYSTLPQAYNMGSVSEAVHAKYTIEYLLDAFRLGVERTYLYELLDERPDPGGYDREAHFGLFRYDGSAKPAATAIRNMMTLLADQATGAAPATLNSKLTGQPWDTQSMLFQKSDGTFLIALWNEVNVWNANTSTHTPAASVNVVLDLPATYGATQVYDPLLGTGSIRSLGGVGNAIVALPDHPIFIEVRGGYPAPTGIVLDDADALTGTLGAQRWGEARISALDWTGKAALVTREASGLGVAGGRNATQIRRAPARGASRRAPPRSPARRCCRAPTSTTRRRC